MACVCSQLLRIPESLDRKRCACPACKRKFLVTFTEEGGEGRKVLCPAFIDDGLTTGETIVPEIPDTLNPGRGAFDDALDPKPPPQLYFPCPSCSRKIVARKDFYDKRARCPDCNTRMIIHVIYDPARKVHEIHPVRTDDRPSGETWVAER